MLCVSVLVVSLANTILNGALPALIADPDVSEVRSQGWSIPTHVSSSSVFAGLLLVAGSVGARVGRKKLSRVGPAISGAASVASAFSTTVPTLRELNHGQTGRRRPIEAGLPCAVSGDERYWVEGCR